MKHAWWLISTAAVLLAVCGWAMGQATAPPPAGPAPAAAPSPAPAPAPAAAPAAAPAPAMAPAPALGSGRGQVVLTWDEFVKITGYDPSKKGQQVVTIPWKEVESLLGVELKGKVPMDRTMVDLPWADFKALLE